jgi:glycosyltransferase involved in cell wall biosynthesis
MSDAPFVSVIVPVYNDAGRLATCLEALEDQTYASQRYEVVVVDNASSQPIAPLLDAYAHAVPVYEAQAGSYAARDRGLAVAKGSIVAFTDADCIPAPVWLEEGVAALQRQRGGLIAGRVDVFAEDSRRPNPIEAYEMLNAFRQERYIELGFAPTANLFTTREVLDAVGPFDAALKSGGDREWTSRAIAAGWPIAYHEAAVVKHPARRSLGELTHRLARIAGGHFARSRADRRLLMRERLQVMRHLVAPAKLAAQAVVSPSPAGFKARCQIALVGAAANWSYVAEWVRLELGAAPRR